MKITETIKRCLKDVDQDPYHRYRSWDHCNQAFAVSEKIDRHSLELAFYLASWGMYRGSSGLLQKNHRVHEGAVDILFTEDAQKLKCDSRVEISRDHIGGIMALKEKLSVYYGGIAFLKSTGDTKEVSPTDTLISKILLGTLGCCPAYDQYFVTGIKSFKRGCSLFNSKSLHHLFDFIESEDNRKDISSAQSFITKTFETHYPIMKVIDMYFWQIGYEKVNS